MSNYYRIMLGQGHAFAEEAYKGQFIAGGFIKNKDLSGHLPDNWRDFNRDFIPIFIEQNPGKSRVAAGLACGMLWTISKGINVGDIVLCPNGQGIYHVGEVTGGYQYASGQALPHRRPVKWLPKPIDRGLMSERLKHAAGSIGSVSNITQYAEEIEALIAGSRPPAIVATDSDIENPVAFALEEHH